ncbi:MAG: hypothetical protein K0V04_34730 [Deltaproteobacteria bacterium]|nr:hypothetical protein [Deltaproteobacteria bacterium]
MYAVALSLAAALGTLTGLFLGIPVVGFALWPVTRALCRLGNVAIDLHDDDDPVIELEGTVAAGLGMALGVTITVAAVGLLIFAPRTMTAALAAGLTAGIVFGGSWRHGYTRQSATHLVLATAAAGALAAAAVGW